MNSALQPEYLSFPRKRESREAQPQRLPWTPAFAGVTMRELRSKARSSRALRCDADVLVLVKDIVERILVVFFDAEDADHPVGDVAIVVKADFALQGLQMRRLDGVAHRIAGDLLAGCCDPLDRVEDNEGGVVGRYRVILGLLTVFLSKFLDERFRVGIVEDVRRGDGRIPPLGRGKAGAAQYLCAIKAVAAALDQMRKEVGGLLDDLYPGLRHAAVIEGVGIERLDFR